MDREVSESRPGSASGFTETITKETGDVPYMVDPPVDQLEQYELFIDGEFRESSGDDRIVVDFPYNGEEWASVPDGTVADIDDTVAAARDAFQRDEWRDTPSSDRREILNQIADVIDEHATELGELETLQNGTLLREMEPQMNAMGDWYRYYGRICDEVGDGRTINVESNGGEMFNYVRHEPTGSSAQSRRGTRRCC